MSATLDLDDQSEAPEIEVKLLGHSIRVDLVGTYRECVSQAKGKDDQERYFARVRHCREFLELRVNSNGQLPPTIRDTQAARFLFYLLEQYETWEKKVLPKDTTTAASPSSTASPPSA